MRLLEERKLPLGGLVLNKALPGDIFTAEGAAAARRMCSEAEKVATGLADVVGDGGEVGGAPGARAWRRWARTSPTTRWWRRARPSSGAELARFSEVVATVPILDDDVTDLSGLVRIGEHLWR